MTDAEPEEPHGGDTAAARAARERRRAAVFGDVLPDSTSDDRDRVGRDGPEGVGDSDSWLRANVPPHHG